MDFSDDYIVVEEEPITELFNDSAVSELTDESQEIVIFEPQEPQLFSEVPITSDLPAVDDSPSLLVGDSVDYGANLAEMQEFLKSIDEQVATVSADAALVVQSVDDVAIQLRYTNYLLGALLGGFVIYAGFSRMFG